MSFASGALAAKRPWYAHRGDLAAASSADFGPDSAAYWRCSRTCSWSVRQPPAPKRSLASTTTPDVVLMDLQMPDLHAIDATRRLATCPVCCMRQQFAVVGPGIDIRGCALVTLEPWHVWALI